MKCLHEIPSDYKLDDNKFYLAVVGSRTIVDIEFIFDEIDKIIIYSEMKHNIKKEDVVIISGGAKGVDSIAEKYAYKNGLDVIIIKPDWDKYNKAAGFKRNVNIIKDSSFVLALLKDNSKGTLNSISHAIKFKIPHATVVCKD